MSERGACKLVDLIRTGYRHVAKSGNDEPLRLRLLEFTVQYPRYDYLMLHSFVKQEGLVISKKRTYRVYTSESTASAH